MEKQPTTKGIKAFQVVAEIIKIETKRRGLRITADTNELNPGEAGLLMQYKDAQGHLLFAPADYDFTEKDVANLPKIHLEEGEFSKSQILRGKIYRWWESSGGKNRKDRKSSELFYREIMDKLIDWVISRYN